MYLGYQDGKIKFYTETPLNKELYRLDKIEETDSEYILDGEEYVLKDETWRIREAEKEAKRKASLKLTKREVFLAIYKDCGLSPEDIRAGIADTEALIEFEYANEYYRGNPLIDTIGSSLGYTKEDLDYLFEFKSFPEPKLTMKEAKEDEMV